MTRFSRKQRITSWTVSAFAVVIAVSPTALAASDLYVGSAIVTGRGNLPERKRGVRESLTKVLVKLSADPTVTSSDKAQRWINIWLDADDGRVENISLIDRKAGIQISDEQGTRDRSFVLSARFSPKPVHELLERLDATVLTGERPPIGMALRIDYGESAFVLSRNGASGYAQRLALEDVSRDLAVSISLPVAASVAQLSSTDAFSLSAASILLPLPYRLVGEMRAESSGLWNTRWRLYGVSGEHVFEHEATTFDDTMLRAVAATLDVLAETGIIETLAPR